MPPAGLTLRPAPAYDAGRLADLFNAAFAGYVVPVRIDPERIGRWFTGRLLEEARARGDRAYVLECVEQNPAGVALYRKLGFETRDRLVGYAGAASPGAGTDDPQLVEVDVADAARAVAPYAVPDLPWQGSAPTLVNLSPPAVAYRLGPAYAALTDPAQEEVGLKAIVVPAPERRKGWGARLLRAAAAARHPGKAWYTGPYFPERAAPAEFFEPLGSARVPLTQLWMGRGL